jgi:hypothetical protein
LVCTGAAFTVFEGAATLDAGLAGAAFLAAFLGGVALAGFAALTGFFVFAISIVAPLLADGSANFIKGVFLSV